MDTLRFSYSGLLERSKSLTYRNQISKITFVLVTFLVDNDLLKLDPFNEDGSIKLDLIIRKSNLTIYGNLIMIDYFPKWSRYIDRGGNIENTSILIDGLDKIKKLNE